MNLPSPLVYASLLAISMCHLASAAPTDLDTSFNGTGKVTTSIGSRAIGYDVAMQGDGKIVVAGEVSNDGGTTYAFGVARYQTGGSLDNTFGTSGAVTVTFGGQTRGRGVAVQTDGKIILAGYTNSGGSNNDFAIVRLTTDGPPDTSFGTNGAVKTDFGRNFDFGNCVTLQTDGKIIVAGSTDDGSGIHFAVVRYNTSGSLDTGFGSGGKVTTPMGSGNSFANDVIIQGDGKIVVVGEAIGSNKDFAVARYNTNGSLDTSFGSGTGKFVTSIRSNNDIAYGVALQSDGKILAVGESEGTTIGGTYDFALVRLNTNGSLDTSFSADGKLTTPIDYHDKARSVAVRADGKITVAGYSNDGTSNIDFVVARYQADGSLDPTFGGTGVARTDFGSTNGGVWDMAIQSDGRIIVAGYINPVSEDIALVRFVGDVTEPEIGVSQPAGNTLGDGVSTVSFGSVLAGTHTSLVFTIQNTGNIGLTGLGTTIDGTNRGDFTVTTAPSATVAPASSTTFTVRFAPAALGARAASLHIASNDADENPFDINFTGTASLAFTSAASSVTSGWATLHGTANPNGQASTAYFQFGVNTGYGSTSLSTSIGSGTAAVPVSFNIAGLSKGMTYHYRLVVVSGGVTYYGADQTFTTPSTVSPAAWHSSQLTAVPNAADGNRTGAAHSNWYLYYYKGSDSNIWCCYWTGTQWAQVQLTFDGNVDDWLAFGTAYNLLCYKGKDNKLWALYYGGAGWTTVALGANTTVAGDVVIDNAWNIIYYRGADSRAWAVQWSGTQWTHTSLGGTATVQDSLAVDGKYHLVYYRGTDNQAWCYSWSGTAWAQKKLSTTANVGGSVAADSGGLLAYYRSSADSSAWCVYWNGSAWVEKQLDALAGMSTTNSIAPFAKYVTLYLTSSAQCAVERWTGSKWSSSLLGDGGSGLTGGLSLHKTTNWAFARRSDGHVVIFYYQ